MEGHGFIRDMMDVKILILFALARSLYPVDAQQLYELCYQDDCLSYFDLRAALPQLVSSGHLLQREDGTYVITRKGRENGAVVEDSLAFPVAKRVEAAVERFNRRVLRDSHIRAEVMPRENGEYAVVLGLDDEVGSLMTLELMAPSASQARRLASAFHRRAEDIFGQIMNTLLDEAEGKNRQETEE